MELSIRKKFKSRIGKGSVIAPFLVDGMQAKMVERHGFEAGYLTGFGMASTLGLPDVGLISLGEIIAKISTITAAANIPFIADADTGYGNYMNAMRTVREYERAGVAALHIEDQVWPKRCGYMANKQVVSKEEAENKIKAALDARTDENMLIIARTDALAVYGWDEVEARARSFMELGADMIFVDGIRNMDTVNEYQRRLGDLPKLLNNVPHMPIDQVMQAGQFDIILHPGPMSLAWKMMDEELAKLKATGNVSDCDVFGQFNRYVDILGAQHYFDLDKVYGLGPK